MSRILSCHSILIDFSNSLSGNGSVSLHNIGILSRSHKHTRGLAEPEPCRLQPGVKLDSISLSDICTESSKCHTGFCNSGSDLLIKKLCSGKSAFNIVNISTTFSFVHSQ